MHYDSRSATCLTGLPSPQVRSFKKLLVEGGLANRVEDLAVDEEEISSGQAAFLRAMEETRRQLQAEQADQATWSAARPVRPMEETRRQL